MSGKNKKIFFRCFIVFSVLTAVCAFAWFSGFRFNLTESYPKGLWRLNDKKAEPGDCVLFCPPDTEIIQWAKKAGYLWWGICPGGYAPMIKKIVAQSGDLVEIGHSVDINGVKIKNSGIITHDSSGRLLPHAQTCLIGNGEVFLMSDYSSRSFDSRYFGPVNQTQIIGVIKPVFTW